MPFSFGAWIKIPKPGLFGSVMARMDDRSNYRGWDMWLEGGRIATHLVHEWPEDALKVVARGVVPPGVWTHVFITYDGSARAAGVNIFLNGERQETDVHADNLKQSIRTEVPFKVGQRHTGSRIDQLAVHTLRIYDKALSPVESAMLAGATRAAAMLRMPAANRSQAELDQRFLLGGAACSTRSSRKLQREACHSHGGRSRDQNSWYLCTRDARASRARHGVSVAPRGVR